MSDKKATDIMLERIKYFINAIENGEYEPQSYKFTINLSYQTNKEVTIQDSYQVR